MKTFLIIITVIVFLIIIIVIFAFRKSKPKNPLPPIRNKVGSLVQNDKMVVVVGNKLEEVEEIVIPFRKLYNRNDYKIDIKLHAIEEKIIVLTFPNDIDFVVFFYLIKNLTYPPVRKSMAKVLGWCTLLPIEKEKPISKQAMIYATDNPINKEVYLTTQDNECWKVNFDKNQYEPSTLIQQFSKPPYTYLDIKHRDGYFLS